MERAQTENQVDPDQIEIEPIQVVKRSKAGTGSGVHGFLEKARFLELKESRREFLEWFSRLSYEDFVNYLNRLNGILRNASLKNRGIDGQNVIVTFGIEYDVAYVPPYADQKEVLLKDVLVAMQVMSKRILESGIDDEESDSQSRDMALLIYYAIQDIHLYKDGNGRLGRLLFEIFNSDPVDFTEEGLSKIIDHDKTKLFDVGTGRDSFAEKVMYPSSSRYLVNRETSIDFLGSDFCEKFGQIYYSGVVGISFVPEQVDLAPEESAMLERILAEGEVPYFSFRGIAFVKLIQEYKELEASVFEVQIQKTKKLVSDDENKNKYCIDDDVFLEKMTTHSAMRLIEIHRDLKARSVETLIDIFLNPNDHIVSSKDGSTQIPVKDRFWIEKK